MLNPEGERPANLAPLPPDEPAIRVAARLLAEDRPAEAARHLGALVAAVPAYAAALALLARAYEAAGRPADALDAWHRAYFFVPASPLVRRERQRLLDAPPEPDEDTAEDADAAPEPPAETSEGVAAAAPDVAPEPPAADAEPAFAFVADAEADGDAVLGPADSLAATPGGDLADARFAFVADEPEPPTSDEAGAEAAYEPEPAEPPSEEPAAPPDAYASAAEDPDVLAAEAPEEVLPDEAPPVDVSPVDAPLDVAGTDAEAPEPEATEAEPLEDAPEEPPAGEPGEETEVLPPGTDEHARPVLDTADGDAAWWARSAETPDREEASSPDAEAAPEPEAPTPEADGWALLDETEVPRHAPPFALEADIAPPLDPNSSGERPAEDAPSAPASSEDESLADELDALIRRLGDAPRIRPDTAFDGPPPPPLNDEPDDELVSETLARIYAAQQQFAEAASVYEKLALQRPADAESLLRKAAEMRAHGSASKA